MSHIQKAIEQVNAVKGVLPKGAQEQFSRMLTVAALGGDPAASNYLFLLNWKPEQKAN